MLESGDYLAWIICNDAGAVFAVLQMVSPKIRIQKENINKLL